MLGGCDLRVACPEAKFAEVTWPGLSADGWRDLEPGRAELTTVVPSFAELTLGPGRWRPISSKPEFTNQVAVARWHAASTVALSALIPNLRDRPDRQAELSAIVCPTLVISGGEDSLSPPEEMAALARAIPHARWLAIPGAGHLSNLERPDEFVAAIADFL